MRALAADIRRSGGVQRISSYLDAGGKTLVSADRHATVLPVVLAEPKDERIAGLIATVERANGDAGFAATSRAATRWTVTSRSSPRAT